MKAARRAYVAVGDRRVHYRVQGEGPPLVMLHGSPADSRLLAAEMAVAAKRHTCIAFDTPGFGYSDPLPGDVLTVRDLAKATVEVMRTLSLGPCPLYGTHTGAAIALEVGVGWPDAVTGLVLEGVPAFTDDEIAMLFVDDYFEPLRHSPLGGHLFDTWMRFRDQFTWFPWYSRDVTRLNAVDRPSASDIDAWVTMYYRSCDTYRAAYRAACFYGGRALRAAEALTVPAVFFASAEDMLAPHLDRLPGPKVGQRIVRLPHDAEAKYRAIVDFVAALPAAAGAWTAPRPAAAGRDPGLSFVDCRGGQVLLRTFGEPSRDALVVLHDVPGTGLASIALARSLADRYFVLVPDLPGNGESFAPADDELAMDAAADAVAAIADELELSRYAVLGVGLGSVVAAALALRDDFRRSTILMEHAKSPDAVFAASIAPNLPIADDGSHWSRAWLMLRDAQIYEPWFDGRIATQKTGQGNFDARWLHEQTSALMTSRATYHRLAREAAVFDAGAAIARGTTMTWTGTGRPLADFVRDVDPFSRRWSSG